MEVFHPTARPSTPKVSQLNSSATNDFFLSNQTFIQRDVAKRETSSSEDTAETLSSQEECVDVIGLSSFDSFGIANRHDCDKQSERCAFSSKQEQDETRELEHPAIKRTNDNDSPDPPAEYNFKHFLHYLKNHVGKSNLLDHRDKIEAMLEEGRDIDEIRTELIIHDRCPRLFVEAILIDQYRIYLRTQSMILAKVDAEKIFHVMTEDEGGDEELVKSLILAGYGHASTRGVLKFDTAINQRDPRAFRLVSRMVLQEKVKFMLRIGVPEGGIRQQLARKGWMDPVIDEMLKRARLQENAHFVCRENCVDGKRCDKNFLLKAEDGRECIEGVGSCDTDDDDEDYCSPPAGTTFEEDSKTRLRTAVYRKVKEMVEEGKSDVEIRVELVAMKCVEPSLVECFLEESHDQEVGREHNELDEESLKALDETIPNLVDHKTEMTMLSGTKPNPGYHHHHPLLVPDATLKQRQLKVKIIKKILMLQQAHVSPDAIHSRFKDHPMVTSDLIDVVLHHGAERISNSCNKAPRTPSELIKSDPVSGDGCLFQKLRLIFASGKCPFQA